MKRYTIVNAFKESVQKMDQYSRKRERGNDDDDDGYPGFPRDTKVEQRSLDARRQLRALCLGPQTLGRALKSAQSNASSPLWTTLDLCKLCQWFLACLVAQPDDSDGGNYSQTRRARTPTGLGRTLFFLSSLTTSPSLTPIVEKEPPYPRSLLWKWKTLASWNVFRSSHSQGLSQ
jgi:hypothetical protein